MIICGRLHKERFLDIMETLMPRRIAPLKGDKQVSTRRAECCPGINQSEAREAIDLSIKADIFKGPLDPGGQPEIKESNNKLLLGLFAWRCSACRPQSLKAVLADRERYQDYWQWPHASRLVQQAEQAGFDFEVPFGRYLGHGREIGFNDEQLDVVVSAAALSPDHQEYSVVFNGSRHLRLSSAAFCAVRNPNRLPVQPTVGAQYRYRMVCRRIRDVRRFIELAVI